ncbi:MAG: c-type cytochrome [Chitinophagaceae bacterium]|nr:c-type cytochrome [Chitinophagaceae bacterium]
MQQLRYISTAAFFIFLVIISASAFSYLFNTRPPDISKSPAAVYQQSLIDKEKEEFIAGKGLFDRNNCNACHRVTGLHSDLFTRSVQHEYWTSVSKIADFLRHPDRYSEEPYIQDKAMKYGMKIHIPFPDITDEQMNLMYKYIITADLKSSLQK